MASDMSEYDRLAMAEAGFREAVQQEQAALMTSGVPRAEVSRIRVISTTLPLVIVVNQTCVPALTKV